MMTTTMFWLIPSALFLSLFLFCFGVSHYVIGRMKRNSMVEKIRGGVSISGTSFADSPLSIERVRKNGWILKSLQTIGAIGRV